MSRLILEKTFLTRYYSICCRTLEDGDIVNVDVTVYYKGVHGTKLVTRIMNFYISKEAPYLTNG